MSPKIVRLAALMLTCAWAGNASAGPPKGIGVMGDSYSDEYRFYPPHCSRARNWVEFLAESRGLNFGPISEYGRGEPRNQGFAYNWARSAATTSDLIATGQHTGLAAQVASGEVDVVAVFIGGNDFINATHSADPVSSLRDVTPIARANLRIAVETILRASKDVKVVLITVPDIRNLPEFREPALPADVSAACVEAMRSYNDEIKAFAGRDRRVAIIDLDRFDRVSRVIAPRQIVVADQFVDRTRIGDAPGNFFLGDRRHMGTVGQAMVARLVVDKLNQRWDAGIPPIRDEEVVSFASKVFDRTQTAEIASEATASTSAEGGGR